MANLNSGAAGAAKEGGKELTTAQLLAIMRAEDAKKLQEQAERDRLVISGNAKVAGSAEKETWVKEQYRVLGRELNNKPTAAGRGY